MTNKEKHPKTWAYREIILAKKEGRTNLAGAVLTRANLAGADLTGANLAGVNFSQTTGLQSSSQWMKDNFKWNNGYIVYKAIGDTNYAPPSHWEIKEGNFLTAIVNPNRTDKSGCGVNFGTKDFCQKNYPNSDLWECLIHPEDLPGVVVPYNTDGKARCERLQLIRRVK